MCVYGRYGTAANTITHAPCAQGMQLGQTHTAQPTIVEPAPQPACTHIHTGTHFTCHSTTSRTCSLKGVLPASAFASGAAQRTAPNSPARTTLLPTTSTCHASRRCRGGPCVCCVCAQHGMTQHGKARDTARQKAAWRGLAEGISSNQLMIKTQAAHQLRRNNSNWQTCRAHANPVAPLVSLPCTAAGQLVVVAAGPPQTWPTP